MIRELLLGIDIGTTSVKGLLVDVQGQPVAQSRQEYSTSYLRDGWVEQNPNEWWNTVKKVIRELIAKSGVSPECIKAVGVGGHGSAALPIDEKGKYLRPAIIWMDKRAQEECREISKYAGEAINRINKYQIIPLRLEPKILWIRKHEKEIYNKTYKFISPTGYVNFKLTNNLTVNYSDGGLYLAYDPVRRNWSEDICASLNISRKLYPDIVESHQIIGTISDKASLETGLAVKTPVVGGGEDTSSGALGAGVVSPGQVYAEMGTGSNVGVCIRDNLCHSNFLVFPHVIPGFFLLNAQIVDTGYVMKWASYSLLCNGEIPSVDEEPSGMIFLPYIGGQVHPIYDQYAKGVIAGISIASTKERLIKAVMEGCGYSMLENIDAIRDFGVGISDIRITGGVANNPVWLQINADITGLVILVPEIIEGSLLGNAILSAVGIKLFPDVNRAVKSMVRINRKIKPRLNFSKRYQKYYVIYKKLLKEMREVFCQLDDLAHVKKEK